MPGVLLFAGATGAEQLPSNVLELATVGRALADRSGGELVLVIAGKNAEGGTGGAQAAGAYGVDRVLLAEYGKPTPPSSEWLIAAAQAGVEQVQPQVVLFTHGHAGRELAPGLAFRLGSGVVTDATRVRLEGAELVATKPVYGGNAIAEYGIDTSAGPAVVTMRARSTEAVESRPGAQAQSQALAVSGDERIQVLEEVREVGTSGPKLKDAKVIVAGGRGVGGPEGWPLLEELAQVLGGAVGASRAVTDAGWVPPTLQIGLTGVAVAPDLYITVGISGAVQHIAGITGSRAIVAINKDADANIFKYARYGVAADWKQVLPAFTQRLKELKS